MKDINQARKQLWAWASRRAREEQSSIPKRDITTTESVKRWGQDVRQASSPTIGPREKEASATLSDVKEEILIRIKNKPRPILARAIDQLISIPFVGPLRLLRAVGEDEQKIEERNLLKLYWEAGITGNNLGEAIEEFKSDGKVSESDHRVIVLENLRTKLQEYEAGHPLASFFFKKSTGPLDVEISPAGNGGSVVNRGFNKGIRLFFDSSRNVISRVDGLFLKKGLRFLLTRGLGVLTSPLLFLAKKIFGLPSSLLLYFFLRSKTGFDKPSMLQRKGEELLSSGLKKTFDLASNIFSAKNLGWLRVSLLGLFGGGAILLPLPLPLRLVFLGLGGSLGVAQMKHSGGSSFLTPFLYRGAFLGGRLLLSALAAGGPPAWAIAGGIIAGIVVLVVLTGFISSQQSIFLPTSASQLITEESAFIKITKTADKYVYKGDLPVTVTFTLNILAPEKKLSNISIKEDLSVFASSGNPVAPSVSLPPYPSELAVGGSIPLEFSVAFDSRFKDSIVTSSTRVTADVENGPKQEKSLKSVYVQLGEVPMACFVFDNDWSGADKALELRAISILTTSRALVTKLCEKGSITLDRENRDSGYGGFAASGSKVVIYNLGLLDEQNALYTLAHESGHIYAIRNDDVYIEFSINYFIKTEGFLETYRYPTNAPTSEDFAETFGVYAVWRNRVFKDIGSVDMESKYRHHYKFAKERIFGGTEY